VPGQRIHVRAEIVDNRLALWVDGALRCEWLDPIPFTGGYLTLYGFYPGKAFDNVRIYSRRLPQKVPVTAIGDAFARQEYWDDAVRQYQRVVSSQPGTEVAREAIYRAGLCRYRQKDYARAFKLWEPLRGTDRDELVRLHELERELAGDDVPRALGDLETLYRDATPPTRKRVAMAWASSVERLRRSSKPGVLAAFVALHDRVLMDEHTVDGTAAGALLTLGRHQQILDQYPRQRLTCALALASMGRAEDVVEGYPDQRRQYDLALFLTGRSARIDPDFSSGLYAMGMVKRGQLEEMLARFPTGKDTRDGRYCALMALGRLEDVVRDCGPEDLWARGRALAHLGRFDEIDPKVSLVTHMSRGEAAAVIAQTQPTAPEHAWARHQLGIEAWARGDHDEARRLFATPAGMNVGHMQVWFLHHFVVAFLASLEARDFATFDRACAEDIATHRWFLEQVPWHEAMYLAGRIDDAGFLAAPHHVYFDAQLLVCRGMRHERDGEPDAALADYRAWLALPPWRRGLDIDVALREFIEFRVAELGK
jgi:tetratricopeptide (TPR) repeat protein